MSYQMIKEKKIESKYDPKRKKIELKYDPKDLFLGGYDYNVWSENEEDRVIKNSLKIYHRCRL